MIRQGRFDIVGILDGIPRRFGHREAPLTGLLCNIITLMAVLVVALSLSACSSVKIRREDAFALIKDANWQSGVLNAGNFDLLGAWPISPPSGANGSADLTIYIEGDGLAFSRPSRPSQNPTPTDAIALKMAIAHQGAGAVAYLGRPCQYVLDAHLRNCDQSYWTNRRYAPEVISSASYAIDQLKERSRAKNITLVGYSGGGSLAVLLAAKRTDVTEIITVAANIDLGYWVARDHFTPLTGSLDPADFATDVAQIPQIHLTGEKDTVIGTDVVQAFLAKMPPGHHAHLIEYRGFSHNCCWAEQWRSIELSLKNRP